MSRMILERGQGFGGGGGGSGQGNHPHHHAHPSQTRQRLWHNGTLLPSLGRSGGATSGAVVIGENTTKEDGVGYQNSSQGVSSSDVLQGTVTTTTLPRLQQAMQRSFNSRSVPRETDDDLVSRFHSGINAIAETHRSTKSRRNGTWTQQKSRSLQDGFEPEGLDYMSRSRRNSVKRPVDEDFRPKIRELHNEYKRRGRPEEDISRDKSLQEGSLKSNPRTKGLRTVAQLTREGTVEDFHRVDLGSSYRVISGKQRQESSTSGAVSLPRLKHIPPRSPDRHHKRRRVEFCVIPDTIEAPPHRISISVNPPPKPLRSILKNSPRNNNNLVNSSSSNYLHRDTNDPSFGKLRLPCVSRTSSGCSNSSFLQVPSPQPRPKMESVLGFSCSKEFEAVFRNMDMEVKESVS